MMNIMKFVALEDMNLPFGVMRPIWSRQAYKSYLEAKQAGLNATMLHGL